MDKDPIVEQAQKIPQRHAAKFHYGLDAIRRDLQKQGRKSERRVVLRAPKKPARWVKTG